MSGAHDPILHIPALLLVLCFASAGAVYIGLIQWTRGIALGGYDGRTARQTIWPWLLAALFCVTGGSLALQIAQNPAAIGAYSIEIFLLAALSVILYRYERKNGAAPPAGAPPCIHGTKQAAKQAAKRAAMRIVLYVLFLLALGLACGAFIALALSVLRAIIPHMPATPPPDPWICAVFLTGFLALAPPLHWRGKALKAAASGTISIPARYKFDAILWPFIIVLFLLLLPLLLQDVVTSEKFQTMLNARPPLQRV